MIHVGDAMSVLATFPSDHFHCVVTSPPYWGLRDYGVEGQLGLEESPDLFVGNLRMIFEQVRRVLKDTGTLWLNLGDSYIGPSGGKQGKNGQRQNRSFTASRILDKKASGLKTKDLAGIPWRVALALQQDGWYLRQDIIWHKPNPMPESVRDRCTKAHEYIFLMSKRPQYYFDHKAIREPMKASSVERQLRPWNGERQRSMPESYNPHSMSHYGKLSDGMRNRRSIWTVTTKPFRGAHFATFPPDLIEPCILAGCPEGGVVLDPFFGAGTTGLVAKKLNRKWVGIEINETYAKIARERIGA
jgi:DNA modification methylase